MATAGAYTGRDVIVSFSLNQDPTVVPNDFKRLGAVRGKDFGTEWETTDVTADDSPNLQKENLVTFKSFPITLDGISREEETKNQDELEDYTIVPTNDQPCGWLQIVRPSASGGNTLKTYQVPVIFTQFKIGAAYDAGVTFNLESMSNGAVVITYS